LYPAIVELEDVYMLVIERILRDREGIWRQIVGEQDLGKLIGTMILNSFVALAAYGMVLGFFHSWAMAGTSLLKLPLLIGLTLAICLPTLYLFNLVFGAKLTVKQAVSLVMVAVTVMAAMAVAFAPISLFFLITADDYAFFKLLNVSILGLSAVVGLRFLTGGMRVLQAHAAERAYAQEAARSLPAAATVPQPRVDGTPALVGAAAEAELPGAQTQAPVLAQAHAYGHPQAAPQMLPPGAVPVHGGYVLPGVGFVSTMPRPPAQVQRGPSMTLVNIWIVLFGFVGTQLAWTLRPFFGSPHEEFEFFRNIEGNFYAEIVRTIGDLFS
jgi:hypothetical protein